MQPFALCVKSKLCSELIAQIIKVKVQTSKFKVSSFVNKIQRQKIKRALIGFQLTPFWLAKDALLKSY